MTRKFILLLSAAISLHAVTYAQTGSWRQVGPSGARANTLHASSHGGTLYSVEKSGACTRPMRLRVNTPRSANRIIIIPPC